MILLTETAAGFALFRVMRDNVEDLENEFSTLESAQEMVALIGFKKFEDTDEAHLEISRVVFDLAISEDFLNFLRANCQQHEILGVAYQPLARAIHVKSLNTEHTIICECSPRTMALGRGVRLQLAGLIDDQNLDTLTRSLSHSIAVQNFRSLSHSIGVQNYGPANNPTRYTPLYTVSDELDNVNKEINRLACKLKDWYGSHFPELARIIRDNILYVKSVLTIGHRFYAPYSDFTEILKAEVVSKLVEAAASSMGEELTEQDLEEIRALCCHILATIDAADKLSKTLTKSMQTMAPNLTTLLGARVAARLISDGGSLKKLSRLTASKIQILGAKRMQVHKKHNAPDRGNQKYGWICLADLVRRAPDWNNGKGKMCRSLAAKVALAIRCDALAVPPNPDAALADLDTLEARLARLWGM